MGDGYGRVYGDGCTVCGWGRFQLMTAGSCRRRVVSLRPDRKWLILLWCKLWWGLGRKLGFGLIIAVVYVLDGFCVVLGEVGLAVYGVLLRMDLWPGGM